MFLNRRTMMSASHTKNLMFLNAATTARVQNRQARVSRSKYPRYSLSTGTKKQVMPAAASATMSTTLLFAICPMRASMCFPREGRVSSIAVILSVSNGIIILRLHFFASDLPAAAKNFYRPPQAARLSPAKGGVYARHSTLYAAGGGVYASFALGGKGLLPLRKAPGSPPQGALSLPPRRWAAAPHFTAAGGGCRPCR